MRKRNKLSVKTLIVGIFLCLAIGFAVLTSNLNINGLFLFSSNEWDIHFENPVVDSNSTVADIPEIDDNTMSFTATLKEPTDNYTFYVDVVNGGTLDAMFNSMSITGLEDVTDYVTSTVTYENGTSLNQNDILYKNFSTRLKISIVYKDITKEQIPNNNIEINASVAINYKQANGDAKLVAGTNQVNFDFSGAEDTYVVPYNGVYQLEVWGGQGGSYNETYIGGYGGYSTGNIKLQKGESLYINVGGAGTSGLADEGINYKRGGYNGGGDSSGINTTKVNAFTSCGGGGATHIATSTGLLTEFDKKRNDIIIVAGGGGGNGWVKEGACKNSTIIPSGGGISGVSGEYNDSYATNNSMGGTQDSGAFFGKGESCNLNGVCDGGGAGYYGGYRGFMTGGGGSGYIGNENLTEKSMYCYKCEQSPDLQTKTVSTENVDERAISKYAKIGNGYARISLVSKS